MTFLDDKDKEMIAEFLPSFSFGSDAILFLHYRGVKEGDGGYTSQYIFLTRERNGGYCADRLMHGPYPFNKTLLAKYKEP